MKSDFITVIKRTVRAGFLSFWRNGFVTLSSILMMTVTLTTLGLVLFTGIILNQTLQSLRDQADISVYFTPSAPEDQIQNLEQSLQLLPEVANVEYVSSDQELASFRERHQNDALTLQALDELGQNPLGGVLNIKAKDITQYDAIANFLKQQEALGSDSSVSNIIDKVNYFDQENRAAINRLASITDAAERIGLIIILILAAMTVVISINTIRFGIYTARDEIAVMQLVGAGRNYIRAPFMVEAVLYGLFAGLLTLVAFYPLTWWLGAATQNFFGGINVFSYYLAHFAFFFLVIVGSGVLLGAIASFLAVRRYLKV